MFAGIENFWDDTGRHPATVDRAVSHAPDVALVAQRVETGSLTLIGRAPGSSLVELRIAGWDRPARFVLRVVDAPPVCELDPYEELGFSIPIAADGP